MLPDFGLITKADKQKLDSIPSDTLLTEIAASNTYITKAAASDTYITRSDAQRYINDALESGGGASSALCTINFGDSCTATQDSYYYKGRNNFENVTVYSNASDSTIETGNGRAVIFNSGSRNVYISNGHNDSIFGFTSSDTLIVKSGGFRVRPSNDEGLRVNAGLNSVLLKGNRVEGTTEYDADNFVKIPVGTKLNIFSQNKKTVVAESISGTAAAESIENFSDNMYISLGASNDTLINHGTNCTIEGGAGTDYIYDSSDGGNIFVYNSGDGVDHICGFKTNDTLIMNGITANSLEGDNAGKFLCYVNTQNAYVKLYGDRLEKYQTAQYEGAYSTNYYNSLTGGEYFWIKNNSDEAEQVMFFGRTDGGNSYSSPNYNDYWKYVFTATNQVVYNRANYVTVVSYAGADTICNDENSNTGGRGWCNLYQRKSTDAADHIFGYDGSGTIHVTDDVPYYCVPTLNGEYGVLLTDNFTANYGVWLKGPRISGKTGYTVNDYSSLTESGYDYFQIKIADKPVMREYFLPTYWMTSTQYTSDSDGIWICGTSAANTINNTGAGASIQACAGNNKITNTDGYTCCIFGNSGNDTILNTGDCCTIFGWGGTNLIKSEGESCSIRGGNAADSIFNTGDCCTIDGGLGNNYLNSAGDACLITGGTGADSVICTGYDCTIDGGTGNLFASMLAGAHNCSITNAGATNVTLYTESEACYVECGNNTASSIISDGVYHTINAESLTSTSAYITLGATSSHNSVICGNGDDNIYVAPTDGNYWTGEHYIELKNINRYNNTVNLHQAYCSIIAGTAGPNNIKCYNYASLGGSGAYNTYIDCGNASGNITVYGGCNDTIISGSSTANILYVCGEDYYSIPHLCSISCGSGTNNITLPSASGCTIASGAGTDNIRIPMNSFYGYGGSNVFVYGNAEGNNYIYGVSSDDTLFIKDNSAVSVGANNSNGIALRIGTNTYVTMRGEFIDGKTDVGAVASYSSLESGNPVCTIVYANGNSSILYAP